jgi:hypothetical protein
VTEPDATGPSPAAIGPHDAPRLAGHVVRRVLLRRNIVIDAETARLVAAAVQAALQAGAPARPPRRARVFPLPTASRCSDTGSCPGRETRPLGYYSVLAITGYLAPSSEARHPHSFSVLKAKATRGKRDA